MTRKNLAAISLVYLELSGTAQAATLFTPPLFFDSSLGTDLLSCRIANISASDMTVQIRIITTDGAVKIDFGTLVLSEGKVIARAAGINMSTGVPGLPAYFRFDVQGGASNYRASAAIVRIINSLDEGDIVAVPAE